MSSVGGRACARSSGHDGHETEGGAVALSDNGRVTVTNLGLSTYLRIFYFFNVNGVQ